MTKIEHVVATVTWPAAYIERLRECLGAERFVHTRDTAEMERELERADVAIISGNVDARFLQAPRLRWVHCDAAGLERSARPEVFERGLLVTSSSGRTSPALAEHALFFMLAFAYNIRAFLAAQDAHQWGIPGQDNLRGLVGHTVGIIGMGNIGRALAVRARALEMRVLGHRRRAVETPEVDVQTAVERGEGLDDLLGESDYVVLAVPLSDTTHQLIGARELSLMKPTAVLVNMARGSIVDEAALIEALKSGRIRGAGLDVFEREPLPSDSPLWDLPNVLITPHLTPTVPDRTGNSLAIICENARRYRAGEPLVNLLTRDDIWTRR
ncbi:MAG: D-2-hydroxyacid dehydrogenase [Chloroflexi bacterium]|nr:D-2-hydroxyacid dehydrogenase [Chloroflexota bacterium]